MSAVDYAIDIVSLSKRFRRHTLVKSGYTSIKSSLIRGLLNPFGKQGTDGHFTQAIKDLTIRVPQGASVGIIGQNGSGKSTLLKLITGIYKPDTGKVRVNGRVAALIELGAGFHPDFTGRENLYLGGVMHGLTRAELDARFEDIVRFAELEDVIDDAVRTYSSGMFMRLGFSLAVHTDPDVLIVDEVLAVGDAAFVTKCKEKITRLRKEGKTLLLVSHDMGAVERWCDEALWLHKGEVRDRGDPRRVIDHYREFVEKGEETELKAQAGAVQPSQPGGAVLQPDKGAGASPGASAQTQRWGSREIEIRRVSVAGPDGREKLLFHPEDGLQLEIEYVCNEPSLIGSEDIVFGVCMRRADAVVAHGSNTALEGVAVPACAVRGSVRYEIRRLGLLDGQFSLDVAVHKKDGYAYDYHQNCLTFAVRSQCGQLGILVPEHEWKFNSERA